MNEQGAQKAADYKTITKQICINKKYSAHLLPITAHEDIIAEIQNELDIDEKMKAKVKQIIELFDERFELRDKKVDITKILDIELGINDLKEELEDWSNGR